MKRLLILAAMLLCAVVMNAQTYKGTLTIDDFVMEGVVVRVQGNSILMEDVKFSKRMPVRVDMTIPNIDKKTTPQSTLLRADNVVPKSGTKEYKKYKITGLQGLASDTLYFNCRMGEKRMSYRGSRQKR